LSPNGSKYLDAKPLKGFGGAGVLEIIADDNGSTYRAVYTVKFAGAMYVRHAFLKKSRKGVKTPKREIDLIRRRLKSAEEHSRAWRAARPPEGGTADEADEERKGHGK
jgi:phage-related protein